jgi:hypothetical protein
LARCVENEAVTGRHPKEREIREALKFLQTRRWPEQQDTDYIGVLASIVEGLLDRITRLEDDDEVEDPDARSST